MDAPRDDFEALLNKPATLDPDEIREGVFFGTQIEWSVYTRRVATLERLRPPREDEEQEPIWPTNIFGGLPYVLDESFDASDVTGDNPVLRFILEEMRSLATSKTDFADLLDPGFDEAVGIGASFNWAPFTKEIREKVRARFGPDVFTKCNSVDVKNNLEPALPDGMGAVVTLRVPVGQLTTWDVKPLVRAISRVLREALKNRPTLDEAPRMTRTVPPYRAFLLHCREDEFQRDLERYKLHKQQQALTFRQIAFMEQAKKMGHPIDADKIPTTIGCEVPGERGVAAAVQRIDEAIYFRPYKARRRRLDTPAEGVAEYRCNEHGQDCPETCPHLKAWLKVVKKMLPTDTTGKGKRLMRDFSRGKRIAPKRPV